MDWGSEPNIYVVGGAEGVGLALVKEILNRGAFMVGVLDGVCTDPGAVDALDGVWLVQHDLSFSCPDLFTEATVFHTAASSLNDPLDRLQNDMRMGLNIVRALTAACRLGKPPRLAAYISPNRVDLIVRLSVGWLFKNLNYIHGVRVLNTAMGSSDGKGLACALCDLVESGRAEYGTNITIGGEHDIHYHAGVYSERSAVGVAQRCDCECPSPELQ